VTMVDPELLAQPLAHTPLDTATLALGTSDTHALSVRRHHKNHSIDDVQVDKSPAI
jgi:hypothetical protein